MTNLLVFDVSSLFGFFRKPFTTTNSLTHAVIPRSAVEGLVGAILGLKSEEFPEKLGSSKIAIQILSPIDKHHVKLNYIHEDWWFRADSYHQNGSEGRHITNFNTRVNAEYLFEPKYRIFFSNPEIDNELKKMLSSKSTIFTPYLGKSSMIAKIDYIGEFSYEENKSKDYVSISSIIPFEKQLPTIKTDETTRFLVEEGLTIHMTSDRVSRGSYNAVLNEDLTEIPTKGVTANEITMNGTKPNIVFLPFGV